MEKLNQIKILDDNLINKIAAGEVIERPSSIVKELVENAIDAGAKNIRIEIKNGGKSYIKIQDDGTGIKKDEINTAFIRHSTSKLTDISDLDNILTLGFRGEALASIASISRIEMTTKTEHDDIGTQISIEGGTFKDKKEIASLVGTTFIIKDVFFNIPARLKFLKKDASESFYITEIITKLALGNPSISFKYINNNTEVISTDGSGILKNTALYIYGGEIAKALLPIEATKSNFKLTGLVGKPEISRGNRNYINFFINNRYIKSKLINDAIGEAYSGKLMNSKFPVVILNLITPEGSVDVNVHPTKLEARFENENFIYEFLIDSIEEELSKHILIPSIAISQEKSIIKNNSEFNTTNSLIDLNQEELDINSDTNSSTPKSLELNINSDTNSSTPKSLELNINSDTNSSTPKSLELNINSDTNSSTPKSLELDINSDTNSSTPKSLELDINSDTNSSTPKSLELNINSDTNSSTPKSLELDINIPLILNKKDTPIARDLLTKTLPKEVIFKKQDLSQDVIDDKNTFFNNYKIIGQIFHTYWLIQQESDLYIIDQHSAHEKIIYEELYDSFLNSKVYSQTLVEPIVLQVSSSEKELIEHEQNQKLFDKFGFAIEKFGEDCYAISRVPFIFKNALSPSSFVEILDALSEDNINSISTENKRNNKSIYSFKVEQIIMMSCKKAVKANDKLSTQEAQALIEKLLLLKDPFNCPHGRPTIVKITKSEIEKFFKRI